MPCKRIGNATICYDRAYRYKGIYFCFNEYTGPYRLNKDGDPSRKGTGRKFFKVFNEWFSLSKDEQKKYEVSK